MLPQKTVSAQHTDQFNIFYDENKFQQPVHQSTNRRKTEMLNTKSTPVIARDNQNLLRALSNFEHESAFAKPQYAKSHHHQPNAKSKSRIGGGSSSLFHLTQAMIALCEKSKIFDH